ncbi:MAG TPA: hypothetical protein VMS86_07570 [Thermoanaerobaculia bacterium]|nr:hypothetical protein [Thermoanaerobaculia bacterium]
MISRCRIASCLLAGVLASSAATADSVYLKNGQIFEGVVAVVSGDQVRIDLAIGSMRLPLSQVDRIEEIGSTLGEYRERETRLRREAAGAGDWLELALWARARDFGRGVEKAALAAARLDPELDALAPVMASLGFVFDDSARQWVPYAESMRRQGLVEDGGQWITPEERRERGRAGIEIADVSSSRADDHLDKALDILAEAVKHDAPSQTTVIVQPTVGTGFGFWPGFTPGAFIAPPGLDEPGIGSVLPFSLSGTFFRGDARATGETTWNQMTRRQPGSFIPANPRFFR